MEWINVIVTAFCSLLAAVGGGTVMFYKQNRKLKSGSGSFFLFENKNPFLRF